MEKEEKFQKFGTKFMLHTNFINILIMILQGEGFVNIIKQNTTIEFICVVYYFFIYLFISRVRDSCIALAGQRKSKTEISIFKG